MLFCTAVIVILEAPKFQFVSYATGLVALSSALFVWLASFDQGYAVPPGILRKFLIFFGTRSYALYIIHVPIIWFVGLALERLLGQPPSAVLTAIVVPVSMFATVEANYRLLEAPLRRYGKSVASKFRLSRKLEGAVSTTPAGRLGS
jgi:peptidoglycan/LPS O-acetylase OafA/YrhL